MQSSKDYYSFVMLNIIYITLNFVKLVSKHNTLMTVNDTVDFNAKSHFIYLKWHITSNSV